MRALVNDALRWLEARGLTLLGLVLALRQSVRIWRYDADQTRLRRRYGITDTTPVLGYGPDLERLLADQDRAGVRHALTSGSTAAPKRIPYPRRRLRAWSMTFVDAFARAYWALSIRRTSLYVLASMDPDDSLTAMLLAERRLPPYPVTLQAPYRVQGHPAIRALAEAYGATDLRVWMLTIANPGVLYSTNPSTLSAFLDEVAGDWPAATRLVRDWVSGPAAFDANVHAIARRLASRGGNARLRRVANSASPLHLREWAPGVEAYCCWTGGYVQPFLDRLARYLPPEEYRLIPMYSASTETIETVSHYSGCEVAFLPLAPGVCYEFIPEGAGDQPANLLRPRELDFGATYTMIVSDDYGLRRYQTGDAFEVRRFVAGLPDLAFVRRSALEYSFTGEKLTAVQLATVFGQLRAESPWLTAADFLTCVPSHPPAEPVPHYRLVLITPGSSPPEVAGDELARRCDHLVGEINVEYAGKRRSGRLGPMRFEHGAPAEFAAWAGSASSAGAWESQFKFLPLYRRTWESMALAPDRAPGASVTTPRRVA